MNKIVHFIIFIALAVIWQNANANPPREYKLSNGLQLIVKEDHRSPIVVSQIWYKVGSSYEPSGITGISHAVEHMMFEGSKKYAGNSASRLISANGGDENASTSYDYTHYYQVLSADKLAISFAIESDRMRNLVLSQEAFNKEMEVIKEERRLRTDNNPQALTYERFSAAAFIANPYHHPVIGWMNDINNYTLADIQNWYNQWYAPNNATIVVAGDVNPDQVYQMVQQYFGAIPASKLPIVKPFHDIKPLGKREVIVRAPAKLPWLLMGFNVPSLKSAKDKSHAYALEVLAAIFSEGNSSRIPMNLIRGQQIASEADAEYTLYSRLPTLFTLAGVPSTNHTVDQLRAGMLNEIKKLQDTLIDPQELNRIKTQLLSHKIYYQDSLIYQANELGSIVSIGMDWRVLDQYNQEIAKVTPELIQFVAKKYLTPDRMTEGQLVPLPLKSSVSEAPISLGAMNVH